MNTPLKQAWEMLRAANTQLGPNPSLEQLRAAVEAGNSALPLSPGIVFQKLQQDGVSGIWCEPLHPARRRAILYFHGAGYIAGSAHAWRGLTGEIARLTNTRTFSVEYHLAPEYPFPIAIEDALAAYRWLLAQEIAPGSIAFAGDSAGGGLCVAALLAARAEKLPMPAAAFLISPWVDQALTGATMESKADVEPLATPAALRGMTAAYLGGHDRRDPLASPLYGDLAGLPPMLIQVGSEETLLDDSVRLAGRAGAAQVKVRLEIYPEMFHEFQGWHSLLQEARDALASAADFLAVHLK